MHRLAARCRSPAVLAVLAVAEKKQLRALYRSKRRALSAAEQKRHAEAIAATILPALAPCDTVAVYLVRDGEVDLSPLVAGCRRRGVALALPVLTAGLEFAAYEPDAPLRANRYGIGEPAALVIVRPTLVLAPLVAFDSRGNRLGMGGGYYDRYFQSHPQARRVGVAHECQRAEALPVAPGDAPLSAVVTETGWHGCRRPP